MRNFSSPGHCAKFPSNTFHDRPDCGQARRRAYKIVRQLRHVPLNPADQGKQTILSIAEKQRNRPQSGYMASQKSPVGKTQLLIFPWIPKRTAQMRIPREFRTRALTMLSLNEQRLTYFGEAAVQAQFGQKCDIRLRVTSEQSRPPQHIRSHDAKDRERKRILRCSQPSAVTYPHVHRTNFGVRAPFTNEFSLRIHRNCFGECEYC